MASFLMLQQRINVQLRAFVRFFVLAWLLLLLMGCNGGEKAPKLDAGWVPYTAASQGLTLEMPEAWAVLGAGGVLDADSELVVASSEALGDFDGWVEIRVVEDSAELASIPIADALTFYTRLYFGDDTAPTIIQPLSDLQIANHQSVAIGYSGTIAEKSGLFTYAVVRAGRQVVFVRTAQDISGNHSVALDKILKSIRIVTPSS